MSTEFQYYLKDKEIGHKLTVSATLTPAERCIGTSESEFGGVSGLDDRTYKIIEDLLG